MWLIVYTREFSGLKEIWPHWTVTSVLYIRDVADSRNVMLCPCRNRTYKKAFLVTVYISTVSVPHCKNSGVNLTPEFLRCSVYYWHSSSAINCQFVTYHSKLGQKNIRSTRKYNYIMFWNYVTCFCGIALCINILFLFVLVFDFQYRWGVFFFFFFFLVGPSGVCNFLHNR